jgi:hypothetical protein
MGSDPILGGGDSVQVRRLRDLAPTRRAHAALDRFLQVGREAERERDFRDEEQRAIE